MSNLVHLGDALGAKVCVDTEVASLTNMSNSQHNVGTFLIKLHFSYDIKIQISYYQNIQMFVHSKYRNQNDIFVF